MLLLLMIQSVIQPFIKGVVFFRPHTQTHIPRPQHHVDGDT
jgi:hypothetical protein